jgi:hypothetical protein
VRLYKKNDIVATQVYGRIAIRPYTNTKKNQ